MLFARTRNAVYRLAWSPQVRTMASLPYRRMHAKKMMGMAMSSGSDRLAPSTELASCMPLCYREMDNSALVTLAALDNHDATKEVLIRHIMTVDGVQYTEAEKTFKEIQDKNNEGVFGRTLPHKLGITVALTAGFSSIPLCFHLPTVQWFNSAFVTADIPEPKDLETWLEVGSWAWNWMEPPLGQLSFLILCLQYTTDQLNNLGVRPFVTRLKLARAKRIIQAYPQYDAGVLEAYSRTASLTKQE